MYRVLISLLFLLTSPAAASFNAAGKGSASAGFLKLGAGARGVAMGEAFTAVSDGADSVFWNPAALLRVKGRTATFMHASYIVSTYYDYGAYAQDLGDDTAFGIGFQYFSAGELKETDVTGTDIGKFSPQDSALTFGYAFTVRGLDLGISFKYVRSTILDTARTLTTDVGLLSPAFYGGKMRFAALIANLGGALEYEERTEKLPGVVKLGTSYRSDELGLLGFDIGFPQDSAPYFAVGAEYPIIVGGSWRAEARCGLNSQTIGDIKGFTGMSFGFGVGYEDYLFDYAFSPLGELGSAHQMSISTKF